MKLELTFLSPFLSRCAHASFTGTYPKVWWVPPKQFTNSMVFSFVRYFILIQNYNYVLLGRNPKSKRGDVETAGKKS
jgi:hypothetical protein